MGKAKTTTVKIPGRNLGDTILDFGEPLLSLLDSARADQHLINIFQILITVWNAHVLAMPVWGKPEELKKVQKPIQRDVGKIRGVDVWKALSERRAKQFADDPRLVTKWDLKPSEDAELGVTLEVELMLPPGTKRAG